MLFTKQLDVLSPLWGFRFVDVPVPGVTPPPVVFRTFGAYLPDCNKNKNPSADIAISRGARGES
jgi:hypothetical protein